MDEYLSKPLDKEQLQRLAFDWDGDDWHDIDYKLKIYKRMDGTYQHYVEDEYEIRISVGIPLKTVDDLINRYKSITGYDLRYHTGSLPITAQ